MACLYPKEVIILNIVKLPKLLDLPVMQVTAVKEDEFFEKFMPLV
jgi:hypothetical protein